MLKKRMLLSYAFRLCAKTLFYSSLIKMIEKPTFESTIFFNVWWKTFKVVTLFRRELIFTLFPKHETSLLFMNNLLMFQWCLVKAKFSLHLLPGIHLCLVKKTASSFTPKSRLPPVLPSNATHPPLLYFPSSLTHSISFPLSIILSECLRPRCLLSTASGSIMASLYAAPTRVSTETGCN